MALAYSLLALWLLMAQRVWRWVRARHLTTIQWFQLVALATMVPIIVLTAIYGLLESGIGERIAAHGFWDKSAESRQLAPLALTYMKSPEIWLRWWTIGCCVSAMPFLRAVIK